MIRAACASDHAITVEFDDGTQSVFPAFWLRDHARDAAHFDATTHQRLTHTAELDPAIGIDAVELATDGRSLIVTWGDGALPTSFTAGFLREFVLENTPLPAPVAGWDADRVAARRLTFADLAAAEDELVAAIARDGFAVVTDCPLDERSVQTVASVFGYVRRTIYGDVWVFSADGAMADSAYSTDALRPHTDGTYSHDAPGLQLLLCLEYEASGGESVLVDGRRIFERLPAAHRETLSRISVPGEYVGDGAHLRAERPVFRCRRGHLEQVSFNNYDRAPFRLADDDMVRFYEALRAFERLANDESMQWRQVLAPGEMIIFDNWRVLHGRAAFTGHRRMAGCYVNREDYESRLRQQ